jgi:hypothetical protein
METTQETIIKNRTMSMTAVKDAQIMDCASFYKKHEKNLEWDEVENLSDFNDGMVNLIYHGTDQSIAILFIDGEYDDWSYCS